MDQVYSLAAQNYSLPEIAKQLNLPKKEVKAILGPWRAEQRQRDAEERRQRNFDRWAMREASKGLRARPMYIQDPYTRECYPKPQRTESNPGPSGYAAHTKANNMVCQVYLDGLHGIERDDEGDVIEPEIES